MDAVVLSGGGAYGAYEVGVMKALFNGKANLPEPVHGDIFCGTSVGSLNAARMAMEEDSAAAVAHLEEIWLNKIADGASGMGNGVLSFRGNPFAYLSRRSLTAPVESLTGMLRDGAFFARYGMNRIAALFSSQRGLIAKAIELVDVASFISAEPMRQTIANEISAEKIRTSSKQLRIIATDWENGTCNVYGEDKSKICDEMILASAAIPGIFPPVLVEKSTCVDGGVTMNTPLSPAIEAGADTVHIVSLDPSLHPVPATELDSTLEALMRTFSIAISVAIREDMTSALWINRGLEAMERASSPGDLPTDALRDFVRVAAQLEARAKLNKKLRPITIHHYHPTDSLGSPLGILDFSRETMIQLIARGYFDARMHNCGESGCVVPAKTAAPVAMAAT